MATPPPPLVSLAVNPWDATRDSDALLVDLLDETTNETDVLLAELLGEEPLSAVWETEVAGEQLHPRPSLLPPLPLHTNDAMPQEAISIRQKTTQSLSVPHKTSSALATRADKTKQTLHFLRTEVHQLTNELERLRAQRHIPTQGHVRSAMESATNERLKRRRVEHECQQLRDAVYAQTRFIRGLNSVFTTPRGLSSLNLCHYLHNYTRLPRDRSTRWNEYAALAQEARLQSAVDILCHETQSLTVAEYDQERVSGPSVSSPLIQTELLKYSDGFGVTSTSVYALETNDLSAVLRGACVAVREIVARSQSYECTSLKRQIVDPEALSATSSYSNILYRVMGVHHKSPRDSDELSIESRIVTLYKQTDDHAVVLWDFVDDDELHPENATTDITRQAVGACLIRREMCDDGVQRTVYRAMRTRRYRFHDHTSQEVLRRFEYLIASTMKANDLVFREIVLDSIATEEAAYAKAIGQLQAVQSQ